MFFEKVSSFAPLAFGISSLVSLGVMFRNGYSPIASVPMIGATSFRSRRGGSRGLDSRFVAVLKSWGVPDSLISQYGSGLTVAQLKVIGTGLGLTTPQIEASFALNGIMSTPAVYPDFVPNPPLPPANYPTTPTTTTNPTAPVSQETVNQIAAALGLTPEAVQAQIGGTNTAAQNQAIQQALYNSVFGTPSTPIFQAPNASSPADQLNLSSGVFNQAVSP